MFYITTNQINNIVRYVYVHSFRVTYLQCMLCALYRPITMVRICIICGNVDGFEGVSLHRFPANDEFRRLWRLFVENNGVNVQLIVNSSKLCSRHFVPGLDYR
ncbi:uncharacterized protein LOC112603331, partial [Melanaphis sacchari]|uniref:uncharacterized protein LOC112603331 n=1 Tax=Melanaphis sacchari TaxID=742174 RepID=UPI000DC12DBF